MQNKSDDYKKLFLKSAKEHIDAVNLLLNDSEDINSAYKISEIYRHLHSLKGSSSVMEFTSITEACDKVISIANLSSAKSLTNKSITYIKQGITTINDILNKVSS